MAAIAKSSRADTRYIAAASLAKGIVRVRKGKGFAYFYKKRLVNAATQLQRIKSLAIPPGWTDVNICPHAHGHLQAVGRDQAGRKQYIYHNTWVEKRSESKYGRLRQFGEALSLLRKRVIHDLRGRELTAAKVIATAIRLMENSHMRVGGLQYEKQHDSHGLTTLQNQHTHLEKGKLIVSYTGKKGVLQEHCITDKSLINLIMRCRELPGKRLFQYKDESGKRKAITSTQVNQYIKDATGDNFSAKDFRTWAGSVYALHHLCQQNNNTEDNTPENTLKEMLQYVSARLGNTPTICRKYYIHPRVLDLYEKGGYITRPSIAISKQLFGKTGLSSLEKSLLRLLRIKKDTN